MGYKSHYTPTKKQMNPAALTPQPTAKPYPQQHPSLAQFQATIETLSHLLPSA